MGKRYSDPEVRIYLKEGWEGSIIPTRIAWSVYIYNEAIKGFGKFLGCKREEVYGLVHINFYEKKGDNLPKQTDMPLVTDGRRVGAYSSEEVLLRVGHVPWQKEVMGKLEDETGFYIVKPLPKFLTKEKDVWLIVQVKSGEGELISEKKWMIHDRGEKYELDIEELK